MDDLVLEDDWGTELTVGEFLNRGELRISINDYDWMIGVDNLDLPLETDDMPFLVLNMGDVWKLYNYFGAAFARHEKYLKEDE